MPETTDTVVIVYQLPGLVVAMLLLASLFQLIFVLRSIVKRTEKVFWRTMGQASMSALLIYVAIGGMSGDYDWPLLISAAILLLVLMLALLRLTGVNRGTSVKQRLEASAKAFQNPS